jgi:DEAD/DEAH box helicase domain-containing protein
MLPLQQAREVRDSVIEYIKATFKFKEKDVSDAFYRFIEDKKDGLFKGPFISLKTPFVSATKEQSENIPLEIAPDFPPYLHQLQAFNKLSMKDGHKPEPTLLTTGTGSGKTECFLYPILDYCYHCNKNEKQTGVKVIIMYPMNALATDQAKRLAEIIWNDPRLRGKVTAGLFVGEGVNPKDYPREMAEDHIIENRNAILDTVPDILLTNFKMLDYGLMRQEFSKLWKGNIDTENKLLKFIVLDELHTYDGAQGTDVANLIRRLKLKLNLPKGWLCPIGTSATIGNGEGSKSRLCDYASDVFGERFREEDVIGESRMPVDEYVTATNNNLPNADLIRKCVFDDKDTVESYMKRLCKVWLRNSAISPVDAGKSLREMGIVRSLLNALSSHILPMDDIMKAMINDDASFRRLFLDDGEKVCMTALENLLALIAYAKRPLNETGKMIPMLYLQVQLWQRELSGILRYFQKEPEFTWRYSLKKEDGRVALPMYFCRECGASGWISRKLATDDSYCSDISTINKAFMDREKEVVLLNIESKRHEAIDDYVNENATNVTYYVSTKDLREKSESDSDTQKVRVCSKTTSTKNGNQRFATYCPECNSDAICQIGGRTSTLSSVAVSQVLSSDFDHADGKDRKILVFTNSVQDAAHDAGFYEARTFRFLFRQSMQKYINTLNGPVNIVDLQKGFKEYWKKNLSEEDYYSRFLPADLATHIDLRRNYREGAGFMSSFKKEFDLRVDWEIASEFGLMSQLGRTLEKTGCSATFFKREDIHQVYVKLKDFLGTNNLSFVAEDEDRFCHFVYGILQRMRRHGAVDHPYYEKYRNERLTQWALNWDWDSRHFLNRRFFGGVRFPKLVGINYQDRNADMLDMAVLRREKPNWYSNYFWRYFNWPIEKNVTLFNDFIHHLFEAMEQAGLVNYAPQGGGNYVINPDHIWVSRHVKHIKCSNCQSTLYVAKEDPLAVDTLCLDYKCNGTYSEETIPELNYYQQVYNRAMSPRVYAREHTGLLEREDREKLEKDFKEHPHSDSVNVLTATSTLEMGIDIGDLNVMGNTAVPPKPSNFLQRVGRAGRKEGSALVLNYAHSGEPHDMYYYTYPDEMMEGEVTTPGCFLEAKDILKRHFLAYCIDTWVSAGSDHDLWKSIGELKLTEDAMSSDSFVINRLITFIKTNKATLKSRFAQQYEPKVQPTIKVLYDSLDDESFYQNVLKTFKSLADRLYALIAELNDYKAQEERLQPNDPTLGTLKNLIRATKKQFWSIVGDPTNRKVKGLSVIEYMTNAGLLPNYAFPETGVKLEASVYSSQEKEDKKDNVAEPKVIELVRPASQGIRELAPGNKFYTQKFGLDIGGIPTFDWKDNLVNMRYCSKCDCIAEEGTPDYALSACPKCGDPSWGINVHKYLKFTGARSAMKKDEAALDDSNDERIREQYVVKKHFMFHHKGVPTSYAMKSIGFGIEYCNSMDLYEANYGMQMQSGNKIEVNQEKNIPENGFVTCKYCGKSTPILSKLTRDHKPVEQHYRFCKYRDVNFADDTKGEVFERLYLYRNMQTEAIKILLPIQIMDAPSTVEMFKAGIELGMKEYYHSSPEHIRIDSYSEMNQATGQKDYYLVMYDTIPGGTGYLAKLYNTDEFSKLLQLAYERIKNCTCQLEGKDGCYHCILTYGNQYNRDSFSRERAEMLFAKLVGGCKSWVQIAGSVGTIAQTGAAEDSELELKFVSALKTLAASKGWQFEKVPDEDSYHYELNIIDEEQDTDVHYYIKPQFELTVAYGVRHTTIPDFQFMCTYAKIDGLEIEDLTRIPWWSVFLDGYKYHATDPNMRFYSDFEKREGIREAKPQRMFSWTLTWEDISLFDQEKEDEIGMNAVTRFAQLLSDPQMGAIKESCYWGIVDTESFFSSNTLYSGSLKIKEGCEDRLTDNSSDEDVEKAFADGIEYELNIRRGMKSADKEEWVGFWRRYDLLQFFPAEQKAATTGQEETEQGIDRDEIKMYYPGMEDIVDILLDHHVPFSREGMCELTDDDNTVIASAAMLIDSPKIAIDPTDENDRKVFEEKGYKVISQDEFNVELLKD